MGPDGAVRACLGDGDANQNRVSAKRIQPQRDVVRVWTGAGNVAPRSGLGDYGLMAASGARPRDLFFFFLCETATRSRPHATGA